MTEYGISGVDLVDELRSLICPIDAEGPSKLGKYYTYVDGKRYDFNSYEEARFHSETTGSAIWAYDK
jgi:hypothetical protein